MLTIIKKHPIEIIISIIITAIPSYPIASEAYELMYEIANSSMCATISAVVVEAGGIWILGWLLFGLIILGEGLFDEFKKHIKKK